MVSAFEPWYRPVSQLLQGPPALPCAPSSHRQSVIAVRPVSPFVEEREGQSEQPTLPTELLYHPMGHARQLAP